VVFKTASTYLEIWRQKRWAQQEEDSLGCAWTTDPTISTCRLTCTSSTSRESVRHAPCPDSPHPQPEGGEDYPSTTKVEVTPDPAALQDDKWSHSGMTQTDGYKLPLFPSLPGQWPACYILGFRLPGILPTICLSLTFLRVREAVTKPPEHPQQKRKPGDNSQMFSDSWFQFKTCPRSFKPAPFCIGASLCSPYDVPPIGQGLRPWVTFHRPNP
jgi:hypothetical protein